MKSDENRPISLLYVECEMNSLSNFLLTMMNIIWVIQKLRTEHQIQRARSQCIMQNNNPTFYFIVSFDPMGLTFKKKTYTMTKVFPILKPLQSFSDISKYIPHNHPEFWQLLIRSGARIKTHLMCIVPYQQHASYNTLISSA